MARSALLGSSVAKKYWMALTGLFLCVFLIAHLAGNLQLLDMSPEGQLKFNAYAKFMTTFPLVKAVSYLLYASILFHAFDGFLLAIQNRKARPIKYAYEKPSANSAWYSRQMALLGTLILVFLVIHMKAFWYEMHWGELGVDADGNKDLYTLVAAAFADLVRGPVRGDDGRSGLPPDARFRQFVPVPGAQSPSLHSDHQERGRVLRRDRPHFLRPHPGVDVHQRLN